jgi:hypothetical protein
MKTVKPLDELTVEELCVHFGKCQEIIERSEERKTGELYLFCARCFSPYSIVTRMDYAPICDNCHLHSRITIKESELPLSFDRNLIGLCKLLVRAAGQLDVDKAYEYRDKIYDYIYGKDVWHDDMRLFIDNEINGYPEDFVNEYKEYAWNVSIGKTTMKPDKDEMLEKLYDQIEGLFQIRGKYLRKVDHSDIREFLKLGMEIPHHIARRVII